MKTLFQDIRYSLRTLIRKPGFTSAAVLALALGIGANTAIFSVVYGVLLRSLPYPDQDRIQAIYMTNAKQSRFDDPFSVADYLDVQTGARSFESVAGYQNGAGFTLPTDDGAVFLNGAIVTAGFFDVLGVRAQLGRTFAPGEDGAQSGSMIVISDRLWRQQFKSDPDIVGQTIKFTGGPQTVIGVMPPDFQFPRETVDIWRNFRISPPTGRGPYLMWAVGRLKNGTDPGVASGELDSLGRQLEQSYPLSNTGLGFRLVSLDEFFYGNVRPSLYVLLAAVAFVLLIAASNVANLLLARSTSREKEVAIRAALGAGRARIARQLLTESIVLAAMGGIAGLVIAAWALDVFIALAPPGIHRLNNVSINLAVLGFTVSASLLSGIFFGLAPALQARKVDLNNRLKDAGRGNTAGATNRLRGTLVVAEIALSLILLAGAGITVRSFLQLRQVDAGFDATNVLAVRMGVNPLKYDTDEKVIAFYDEVTRRVRALPGVRSTGLTNSLPPIQNDATDSFTVEGQAGGAGDNAPMAGLLLVTPGYFETMAIPVITGRGFTETDRSNAPPVVIINETLARRFFPNQNSVGKRMKIGGAERPKAPWMEIVGVVKDVKYDGLKQSSEPTYYLSYNQFPARGQDLVIKTSADPSGLIAAVRSEIRGADPDIPLVRVTTMDERMSQAMGEPRFQTMLLSVFSLVALVLAAVGIYGVLSYSIGLRTHEIGVRMSLGASRRDVLRMVIGEGMLLAVTGAAVGIVGALALTRLMSGFLFEVSPQDPVTFIGVSALMLGVALLACFIPARRATRVDPMVALRHE